MWKKESIGLLSYKEKKKYIYTDYYDPLNGLPVTEKL